MDTEQLEHGTFVRIFDQGVLLKGEPGIGKSNLALELLHRGHALIADDVVRFTLQDHQLIGSAPAMLAGLLEIRDLGVLSVNDLFSPSAFINAHPLHLTIELIDGDTVTPPRLSAVHKFHTILMKKCPSLQIFSHSARNLPLILETAIKNHILYQAGKDANQELANRQQQYL